MIQESTEPVHITHLWHDGERVYVGRDRQVTTRRSAARVFTRERAEMLLARGLWERSEPAFEEARVHARVR